MKKSILIVFLAFVSLSAWCQKKSNVQSHKIKSTTVYDEDYEKKGKSVKESFTKFDALGNVIENIDYDKSGKEKQHIYYDYDQDGNKIRETFLKSDGTKEKVIEYKYLDGLKIEKAVYTGTGKLKSKKKYIYEF